MAIHVHVIVAFIVTKKVLENVRPMALKIQKRELDIYQAYSMIYQMKEGISAMLEEIIIIMNFAHLVKFIVISVILAPHCVILGEQSVCWPVESSFSARGIPWENVMAFSSDDCSVMKGCHNSVQTKIKAVQPQVLDIGCICHLANMCCQQGVKHLLLPVDELLIDVFYHFAHSAEFLDYQLSGESEFPAYTTDISTDNLWAQIGKLKTFSGEPRFPLLGRLRTTLSVIAHSNADSEWVFSLCRKIDTDSRSTPFNG